MISPAITKGSEDRPAEKPASFHICVLYIPHNLLVFALTRLNLQTLVVHFMHVSRGLHIAQDVVLQLGNWLQRVAHVLVLLDVADDFGRLCPLGKVNQVRLLNDGGDTVLDKCKIGQVNTWALLLAIPLSRARGLWKAPTHQKRECTAGWRREAPHGIHQSSWCWP